MGFSWVLEIRVYQPVQTENGSKLRTEIVRGSKSKTSVEFVEYVCVRAAKGEGEICVCVLVCCNTRINLTSGFVCVTALRQRHRRSATTLNTQTHMRGHPRAHTAT